MSFDNSSHAYFVAALSSALQQNKPELKDDITARTYLFVLTNAIWGELVKLAYPGERPKSGKDQVLRTKLKSLAQSTLSAISAVDSWAALAIRLEVALHTWLQQNSEVDSSDLVCDLELRNALLNFSAIFFNACYRRGNPMQEPTSYLEALHEINRELWIWHNSL